MNTHSCWHDWTCHIIITEYVAHNTTLNGEHDLIVAALMEMEPDPPKV